MLAGRSGRIITTMDSPGWYYRMQGRPGHRAMREHTLAFSGIGPVKVFACASVKSSSQQQRESWLEKARSLGARAA